MQPKDRVERRQPVPNVPALAGFGGPGDDMTVAVGLSFQGRLKEVDGRQLLDSIYRRQRKCPTSDRIIEQAMSLVQAATPDRVDRPPGHPVVDTRIVPMLVVQIRSFRERCRI